MDNNKNTIILITGSGAQGGAEKQLLKLVNNINDYFIILIVLTPSERFLKSIKNKNIKIVHILNNSLISLFELKNILKNLQLNQKFGSLIIQGWLPKGNIIAFLISILIRKKNHLIFSHRNSFFLFQSILNQLLLFFTLIISCLYKGKILHISNSKSIYKNFFVRYFLGQKRCIIHNGFKIKSEKKIDKSNKNLSKDNINFLYVARFSPEKGYDLLFKVLRNLKFNFCITLVGTGCSTKNKVLIKYLKSLNCQYKLFESCDDLDTIFRENDYTLLFSRSEASPNVLVESMLQSTPCISTPVGNSHEIINNYGWVTNDFKLETLLRDLNEAYEVYEDNVKYKKLCIDAFNYASKSFSLDEMIVKYNFVYKNLISDGKI